MPPSICPQLVSQGVCINEDCSYQHDVHFCHTCKVVCSTAYDLQSHLNGKKHKNRARANARPHPVDNITAPEVHHTPIGHVTCHICETNILSDAWSRHTTGVTHRKKERFVAIQAAFDEADKDKHGITVSHGGISGIDFDFINTDDTRTPQPKTLNVTVILTTPDRIDISDIRLSSSKSHKPRTSRFSLELDESLPRRLWLQKPFVLPIKFDPRSLTGRFYDRLEIVFLDPPLQTQFVITRPMQAVVGSKADLALIKPSAPYQPKRIVKRAVESDVVPGVKPPALASITWVVPLPMAPIPKTIDTLFLETKVEIVVGNLKKTWLPRILNPESYGRHYSVLLFAEEATMNIDIQRYNEEDVLLEPVPPYFRLAVPGLAEKRPSLIVGDRILFQNKRSLPSGRWFEGHVHRVRQHEVDLKFHGSFNSYRGQKYNVRFQLGRLPLRRMHQALGTAFKAERVLFPGPEHIKGRRSPTNAQMADIRAVDRLIQGNPPQLLAVTAILHMPSGSVPFIVFGPPGTGKTVTVVEAMRQILLTHGDARILACAPSNSAADIIAERLSDTFSPSQLFRLNAPSRNKDQLPKRLEHFSKINNEDTFSVPPLTILKTFRVVVSTCLSASVPYGMGMSRGHFTHIFIDEAGQASEPESMVPIKMMADNSTNIVLSGDPKQLGPIIRSPVATDLGLGMSYLDRLMARDVYNAFHGHGISVVKLVKNWRSHPVILEYPNAQFYKGELQPCADPVVTRSLLRSDVLVKPDFPIVFHSITGKDLREGSSPSFFNIDEASQVKRYVEDLRTDRRLRLTDEQIGVISPYHAQVMKIRTLLKKSYSRIKVGSVEEFQGQERRVIIISTVRSSMEFVEFDVRHTLGFVANPRRFNVAMTRAQALLVVIGDASVLSLDPLWRGFMNYVYLGGGWTGNEIDWDPDEPVRTMGRYDVDRRETAEKEMDELIARTKELILESSQRLGSDDDRYEAQADLPWREEE